MQNRAIWIGKKNIISYKVKKISTAYGDNDLDWIKKYTEELVNINQNDLDIVLNSLSDLEKYCST